MEIRGPLVGTVTGFVTVKKRPTVARALLGEVGMWHVVVGRLM